MDVNYPFPTRWSHVIKNWAHRAWELYDENRGLLYIGAMSFTGACMMCVVKLMGDLEEGYSEPATTSPSEHVQVSPLQLIAVRMMLTLVFTISWMQYHKIPHPFLGPPDVRRWLVARGFFGFFGLFGAYFSVQYLSLSDVTTIGFLAPTATAYLGCQILGESFSRREAFAGLASLLGVVLIARPTFLFGSSAPAPYAVPEESMSFTNSTMSSSDSSAPEAPLSDHMRAIAAAVSLLGVFGISMANICMRRVGTQAHIMHSITYFTAWCLIMSVASMAALNIPWVLPPSPGLWLLGVVAVGSLGFMGQILATRGFQLVAAGRGMLVTYIGIVWSLTLQSIFFNVKVSRLSLIGSAIVLVSAVYVTVTKPASSSLPSSRKDPKMLDEAIEGEDVGLMPMLDDDNDTDDDDIEAQTPATPREYRSTLERTPRVSMEMKETKGRGSDLEVVWS